MVLIEKLRHLIVHNCGRTKSIEDFTNLVAKEAGVFNNGKNLIEHKQLVEQFFGKDKYRNLIALLEIHINPELPFQTYVCRFGLLMDFLMSYSHLLYEMVNIYIKPTKV